MATILPYWYSTGILLLAAAILLWLLGTWQRGRVSIDTLDSRFMRFEAKLTLPGTAALVGTVALIAAAIYTAPRFVVDHQGVNYATIACNPFAKDLGPFPHRILTPLLSYLVGLRCNKIEILNTIFAWGLLVACYWCFRTEVKRPTFALLATLILALSAVTSNSFHNSGYTDSTTLLLLLLAWWQRKHPVAFYVFILLGVFNHELVFFMFPWLAYVRWTSYQGPRWRVLVELVIGLGIIIGCYSLFRLWMASRQPVLFTLEYYYRPFAKGLFTMFNTTGKYQLLGFMTVFKVLWILPVIAFVMMLKSRAYRLAWSIPLLLACTWAQLFVAYDSTRLFTHGFLVMIMSLVFLFQRSDKTAVRGAVALLIISLLIPQYYTAARIVIFIKPLIAHWLGA